MGRLRYGVRRTPIPSPIKFLAHYMLQLACRDIGMDCDFIATGETKEEVMQKGTEHSMKEHGMKEEDMTDEMKEKIMAAIKPV